MSAPEVAVGDTVTGRPIGQSRRQTIVVTRLLPAEEPGRVWVIGNLVSRKWPGDFRGTAVMYSDQIEQVES